MFLWSDLILNSSIKTYSSWCNKQLCNSVAHWETMDYESLFIDEIKFWKQSVSWSLCCTVAQRALLNLFSKTSGISFEHSKVRNILKASNYRNWHCSFGPLSYNGCTTLDSQNGLYLFHFSARTFEEESNFPLLSSRYINYLKYRKMKQQKPGSWRGIRIVGNRRELTNESSSTAHGKHVAREKYSCAKQNSYSSTMFN